jgi:hypothetical protein
MTHQLTYLRSENFSHGPLTYCFFALKYFKWVPEEGESDTDALNLLIDNPHYEFAYPVLHGEEDPKPGQHGPYLKPFVTLDRFREVTPSSVVSTLRKWVDDWWSIPPQPRRVIAHHHIDSFLPLIERATTRFQLDELEGEALEIYAQFLQPWYEVVLVDHKAGDVTLLMTYAD